MVVKPRSKGGLIVSVEMPLHCAKADAAELRNGARIIVSTAGNVTPSQLWSRSVGAGEKKGDGRLNI